MSMDGTAPREPPCFSSKPTKKIQKWKSFNRILNPNSQPKIKPALVLYIVWTLSKKKNGRFFWFRGPYHGHGGQSPGHGHIESQLLARGVHADEIVTGQSILGYQSHLGRQPLARNFLGPHFAAKTVYLQSATILHMAYLSDNFYHFPAWRKAAAMSQQSKCPQLEPRVHAGWPPCWRPLHRCAFQYRPSFDSTAPANTLKLMRASGLDQTWENKRYFLDLTKSFPKAVLKGFFGFQICSLKRKVWMQPSSVPTASHKGCFPEMSTDENFAHVNLALLPERVLTGIIQVTNLDDTSWKSWLQAETINGLTKQQGQHRKTLSFWARTGTNFRSWWTKWNRCLNFVRKWTKKPLPYPFEIYLTTKPA